MSRGVWGIVRVQPNNGQTQEVREFNLRSDLCYIGSAEDCCVRVADSKVADRHCLLTRDPDGQVWLSSVGSNKITTSSGVLTPGDALMLQDEKTFYLSNEDESLNIEITFKNVVGSSPLDDNVKIVAGSTFLDPNKPSKLSELSEIPKDFSTTAKPDGSSVGLLPSSESEMESCLTCSICAGIFFECCSVQPCLHSFCSLCFLQWLNISDVCPVCRMPVQNYAKNHQLDALANCYITHHPAKGKTAEEKEKIKKEITKLNSTVHRSSQLQSTSSLFTAPLPGCPLCGYSPTHPILNSASTLCPGHSVCACCSCPVPIFMQHQSTANLVQCEICCRYFCALINSGGCPGCSGTCLTHLTDLRNIALPSDILLRNTVETSILQDYLAEKGIPTSDFIQSCLEQIDPNLFGAGGPTDQSPVCRACGLQFLSRLAYQQRKAIPKDELPDAVTSRPDCYYGRNCRTQRTNISHAYRYNHICEQTRF